MVLIGRAFQPGEGPSLSQLIEELLAAGTHDLYAEMTRRVDRVLIKRILEHTGGNQRQAAQILGITRGYLRKKLRTLGLTITRLVESSEEKAE